MDASSTVVIKVKYGDILRRFSARIVNEELDLSIDGLRAKILSLFNIAPEADLILTYIDEDGDVVALVDADDLLDVVKQSLNPLRITAKLNSEKDGRQFNRSSGNSTPLRSPRVQEPLQNLNTGISEILKSVPEPLRDTLVKLSAELTSKASSSAPGITELVDHLSKVGLSYLGQLPESQPTVQSDRNNDVPESSARAGKTKNSDLSKAKVIKLKMKSNGGEDQSSKSKECSTKTQPEVAPENNKAKHDNVTGGNIDVGKKLKVKKINLCPPVNVSVEKLDDQQSVVNNIPIEKVVNKSSDPHIELMPTHLPMKDSLDGTRNRISSVFGGAYGGSPGSIWAPIAPFDVGSKFPALFGTSPTYDCPYSGIPVENTSSALPQPPPYAVPLRRSGSHNDGTGITFHRGVRCDGCGVHPITGPRFKSKVKVDYDLCSICFSEMGNDRDYIKLDRPVVSRHHLSRPYNSGPLIPEVCSRGSKVKSGAPKLDSRFIQDVNVVDGTVMAPLTPFTKIWRMRNNGAVVWPQRTQLVWIGGDKLSSRFSVDVEIPAAGLPIDHELDVAVDFVAPELPGRYISYWRMASPSGQKFGQRVWVLIQVDASIKVTPRESISCLNLNLPPVSSGATAEIINVEAEPIVGDSHRSPDNSKKTVELVEPVVDFQPNNEQEMKFPINDSLLVGSGAPYSFPRPVAHMFDHPPPQAVATALQEPAVERPSNVNNGVPFARQAPLNATVHILEPTPPAPIASSQEYAAELPGKKEVEEKLLKELEDMGFKQVDLNKEILRMNEYDLEQAVDDLCGVAEWDPLIEELQEMK